MPHSSLTWIDCKIEIYKLAKHVTAQRPTEESNPHSCYFFGKEVTDRPSVRTLNVVSVDIKTNYKPTETFQLIHNVSRATLRGGLKGETIRLLRTDS